MKQLQKIARPRVTVDGALRSTAGHVDWIATCAHCPWTYSNVVKSDVTYQARNHRAHHRAGATT